MKTMKQIAQLERIYAEKAANKDALTKIVQREVAYVHDHRNTMCLEEIQERLDNICNMRKELDAAKQWCENTKKELAEFYAPAIR